ncbi:MAG: class I SAM-dependent methyltransferase [Proteobacteria bacterium]|nr:class I SAM-dependent methyltransferase [Pseudomonadota bacterium]
MQLQPPVARLSPFRRFIKRFHPEAIPWPGSVFYNKLSRTSIFQQNYKVLARDITGYCDAGRVLDIGTGPGWLLVRLYQLSPLLQLYGIDASSSMVEKGLKNLSEQELSGEIEIKTGSADQIPYDDNFFDCVVSTGSLHHWKDPVAALNEIYRVLRPGQYALVYDIASDTPKSVLREGGRSFGRLRVLLLWIHAFMEPFYSQEQFSSLPASTPFLHGSTEFVGVLYRLVLKKQLVA